MGFKITRPLAPRHQHGLTLIEMLVGVAVSSLLFLVLAAFSIYGARSFQNLENYSDLNALGVNAMDILTRDIRQAVSVASLSTNQLVFNRNTNQAQLTFTFNPATRKLTRN